MHMRLHRRAALEAAIVGVAAFATRNAFAQQTCPALPSGEVDIDVHCHTFNARDIPVAGFVQSFLKGGKFGAIEIPDIVVDLMRPAIVALGAVTATGVLTAKEELAQLPQPKTPTAAAPPAPTSQALLKTAAQEAAKKLPAAAAPANLAQLRAKLTTPVDDDVLIVAGFLNAQGDDEQVRSWMRTQLSTTPASELPLDGPVGVRRPTVLAPQDAQTWRWLPARVVALFQTIAATLDSLKAFWDALHRRREENIAELARLSPQVSLFTPSLVDFDLFVDDKSSCASPMPTQTALLGALAERAARGQIAGRAFSLHGFVGFNPKKADALAVAKSAVADHGFVGVKLYLNCGFLPSGNADAVVEQRLAALFEFCRAEEVPVLVHTGSFNAFNKKLRGVSHPKNWADVLRRPGKPLRLCLGHVGLHESIDWLDVAIALARHKAPRYADLNADVFFDISNNDALNDADFDRVKKLLDVDGGALRERLLYGTDWFMNELNQTPSSGYWCRVRAQMCGTATFGDVFCGDFFARNARRFLGVGVAGARSHDRLVDWYRKRSLSAPAWLA